MSVVVLGAGSTGEAFVAALRRLDADVPIAIVERKLVGGECSYYACMPTKALLRPGEALAAARNVPGAAEAATGSLDTERVFWHRDQVTSGWDDSGQESFLTELDVELVRGEGRVIEPGLVRVDDRDLPYEKLVIATGSVAAVPPIPGLAEAAFWTNRDATTTREIPESIVVLGAGPVGCELAQFFRRLGSRVALVDIADHVLPRDDPEVAGILQEALAGEDIALHLGVKIERVDERGSESFRLTLEGERRRRGGATARRDRSQGERRRLRLRAARPDHRQVGHRGRRAPARGEERLGDRRRERHRHVHARRQVPGASRGGGRRGPRRARRPLCGSGRDLHRPAGGLGRPDVRQGARDLDLEGERDRPRLDLRAPKARRAAEGLRRPESAACSSGAVAVGPEAGEWLGQLTLAVKAAVPVDVLRETIQPYPTFSEAVYFAVRDLPF